MPEKLYSIKESAMVNMADTIRQITGTTGPITGEEIGSYVVTNLPNSENLDEVLEDQDDIIAQIQTALEGKASAAPTLQEKTVTPSTSAQTVTPDSGYDGLSEVTVAAIPSSYVKPTTTKTATTYTPTTSNQTIAAGTYCSGAQTIKGDSNLVAGNIKKGVSLFGLTGTHEGGSGGSVDTCSLTISFGAFGDPSHVYISCTQYQDDTIESFMLIADGGYVTFSSPYTISNIVKNSVVTITGKGGFMLGAATCSGCEVLYRLDSNTIIIKVIGEDATIEISNDY